MTAARTSRSPARRRPPPCGRFTFMGGTTRRNSSHNSSGTNRSTRSAMHSSTNDQAIRIDVLFGVRLARRLPLGLDGCTAKLDQVFARFRHGGIFSATTDSGPSAMLAAMLLGILPGHLAVTAAAPFERLTGPGSGRLCVGPRRHRPLDEQLLVLPLPLRCQRAIGPGPEITDLLVDHGGRTHRAGYGRGVGHAPFLRVRADSRPAQRATR